MFRVEFILALCGLFFSFSAIPFSYDACGGSDRCYHLVDKVWLWLVVVQAMLVAACGLAFWRSKSIPVKGASALVLAIGIVATWVVADRMLTEASNMAGHTILRMATIDANGAPSGL